MPRIAGPAVMHTHASTAASQAHSALNFQGHLIILASLSIFKAFQMIEMHPDKTFHFCSIGLLSNKLLIIDWGFWYACVPAAIHLPREQRDRAGQRGLAPLGSLLLLGPGGVHHLRSPGQFWAQAEACRQIPPTWV